MQVRLRDGESFDSLLRRFKSAVQQGGVIREFKQHQSFMSRGERERAKAKRAQRKSARRLRRAA
jgi:ribosomal protein S21